MESGQRDKTQNCALINRKCQPKEGDSKSKMSFMNPGLEKKYQERPDKQIYQKLMAGIMF